MNFKSSFLKLSWCWAQFLLIIIYCSLQLVLILQEGRYLCFLRWCRVVSGLWEALGSDWSDRQMHEVLSLWPTRAQRFLELGCAVCLPGDLSSELCFVWALIKSGLSTAWLMSALGSKCMAGEASLGLLPRLGASSEETILQMLPDWCVCGS